MHKKDKKKVLNILFVPDNQEAPPKNFRIRYSTLNLLLVLFGLFMVSIVFGIITYSQVLQAALEKNDREKELVQLREQLKMTYALQAEIDTIKAYREKVRSSLQGYVKFAEKADETVLYPSQSVSNDPKLTSIFKTVPLKTPLNPLAIGLISQEFKMPGHTGIDIVAPVGTPIMVAGDGRVVFSGWTNEGGNTIIVYHRGGYLTYYRHNSRNVVSVNETVEQGNVIAYLGSSGETSSGPHLHYEIWQNGEPINPRQFLLDLNNLGE